jgi:hypothetical protein
MPFLAPSYGMPPLDSGVFSFGYVDSHNLSTKARGELARKK